MDVIFRMILKESSRSFENSKKQNFGLHKTQNDFDFDK